MTTLIELAEHWARSPRVLILEDDPEAVAMLTDVLSRYECEIVSTDRVSKAVDAVLEEPFDIIFVDLHLPVGNGVELIRAVKKLSPTTPIVVMTGSADAEEIANALRYGVVAFLPKPWNGLQQIRNTLAMFKIKTRELAEA